MHPGKPEKALEAAEGTDAMIARCAELRKGASGRRRGLAGVLVKAPKPGQEERVDLPTIGPDTVESAARAGLSSYFAFYNARRPHSSLDGKTPDEFYFASLPATRKAA